MAYQSLANLYDLFMNDAPYDEWVAFTEKVFQQSNKQIQAVADLGCGTGEITIRLAQKNYRMIGVDYSEEMLAVAAHKANELKTPIQWVHQNLKQLEGITDLDAAVSYCDVINYLTDKNELNMVFQRVWNSLKEGGLFVFDVHSMDYVTKYLINQTFTDVTEESSYIWFCLEGENPGEMYHELTFFQAVGDYYKRLEEFHHQRTYPPECYEALLTDAGFTNIQVYTDFSVDPQRSLAEAERIFFVAEKGPERK